MPSYMHLYKVCAIHAFIQSVCNTCLLRIHGVSNRYIPCTKSREGSYIYYVQYNICNIYARVCTVYRALLPRIRALYIQTQSSFSEMGILARAATVQRYCSVNESWHTCKWVTSHICMSHVTRMNESRRSYERGMSRICMSQCTRRLSHMHMRTHRLIHMRDMTHSYVSV